jgi:hypothetical protein
MKKYGRTTVLKGRDHRAALLVVHLAPRLLSHLHEPDLPAHAPPAHAGRHNVRS